MIITLPASLTESAQEERFPFTIHRASIIFEVRTDSLVTYSFIPDRDEGLTEWLFIEAKLFDPCLYVHCGFDGVEIAIMAAPEGKNELHEFPLDLHATRKEVLALAELAFPTKVFTDSTRILNETI